MKKILVTCACFLCIASSFFAQNTLDKIYIDTRGLPINDDPKITCDLIIKRIFDNEEKIIYSFDAGIETRGSTSQFFPKPSYGIELRDNQSNALDTSIFGWPSDSDFILNAMYNEKSLIHEAFTMALANQLGMYASRTKYVEVYVNNKYIGIYLLMEKIKRSKGRLGLAKLKDEDLTGEEVTGGYIFKLDKFTGSLRGGWLSNYSFENNSNIKPFYQFEYPKNPKLEHAEYIESFKDAFEDAIKNGKKDTITGYKKYIDIHSFIQLMIINEVSNNVDGYRISTYYHKDKNGKLKAGPPWDYNLTYGNADYCNGERYDKFAFDFNNVCQFDDFLIPFYWKSLRSDTAFYNTLKREYSRYRKEGVLKDENLNDIIIQFHDQLKDHVSKNFSRWPILGQYVWPNPYPIPNSWEGEVEELRTWLKNRMAWLDKQWLIKEDTMTENEMEVVLYAEPNPFSGECKIYFPKSLQSKLIQLDVADTDGRIIHSFKTVFSSDPFTFTDGDNRLVKSGLYLLRITTEDEVFVIKIVKV